MNIYVPEAYYEGKCTNGYTTRNAPIFMPNKVGGYSPGDPATVKDTESARYALSKGYVVAAPSARGRTNQNEAGLHTGKAPACIVDLKAAVRYLRYDDKRMPGDAEKIITNGTSAGGALSSLLGATGNNRDYVPYLKAIGAARARDDIFAASCYCPIQNLDNSDTAMEWQFNGIGVPVGDEWISDDLKAMFPAYLNSLGLRVYQARNCKGKGHKHAHGQIKKGTLLTLDENGEGNFKDYVKSYVIASAQKFLDEGGVIPEYDWITTEGETNPIVLDIDFFGFSADYSGRLPFKLPPAFDHLALGSFENSLFGTATIDQQHFTRYGFDNSEVGAPLADAKIVRMMNPTYYIGAKGTTIAQYWRIRHGTIDHHTSLAIPVILATMLKNKGYDVDFWMPWEQDHGGDYDLFSLFAWMDEICDP